MKQVSIIGVNLAKQVDQLHGATAEGEIVFRKKRSRRQFLEFMQTHPRCRVAMAMEGRVQFPDWKVWITPTSASWMTFVERLFAEITTRRIRRGSYSSVDDLETAIHEYLLQNNARPEPFVWTKTSSPKNAARWTPSVKSAEFGRNRQTQKTGPRFGGAFALMKEVNSN